MGADATDGTVRQHASTSLPELRGRLCSGFIATPNGDELSLGICYIQLDGSWHRFFLDAGLLFWRSGEDPEPEDDLAEGETYQDLAALLDVSRAALGEVVFHDGRLLITFETGATLLMSRVGDGAGGRLEELVPSAATTRGVLQ